MVVALYDKVTLLDVAAPLEVFARANDFGTRYRVLLVSADGKPVRTTAFTGLSADLPLAGVPDRIGTLLVPGGVPADFAFSPTTHDVPEEVTPDEVPDALMTVRELVPRAARIASVCTGAFVLARLGLLNGRRGHGHARRHERTPPHADLPRRGQHDASALRGAGETGSGQATPRHLRGQSGVHRPARGIRHRRDDEADLPPQHRRVPGYLPHAFRHDWNRAFPRCR